MDACVANWLFDSRLVSSTLKRSDVAKMLSILPFSDSSVVIYLDSMLLDNHSQNLLELED